MTDLAPADAVRVMELNAQLLMQELRDTRRMAERATTTLSIVVGLIAAVDGADVGQALRQVSRGLITCAERPDLATSMVGCSEGAIDPAMLRAAAALITGQQVELPARAAVTAH